MYKDSNCRVPRPFNSKSDVGICYSVLCNMYEDTNAILVWANTFSLYCQMGSCFSSLLAWVLLPKINAAAKQCPLKDIPLGNIMAKLRKKPDANL